MPIILSQFINVQYITVRKCQRQCVFVCVCVFFFRSWPRHVLCECEGCTFLGILLARNIKHQSLLVARLSHRCFRHSIVRLLTLPPDFPCVLILYYWVFLSHSLLFQKMYAGRQPFCNVHTNRKFGC